MAQLEAGFYGEEHDWRTPPAKLGTPKLFNLITDPQEEYPQASIENYDEDRRAVYGKSEEIPAY